MKLASLRIDNPFVQAPLAGITASPFRTIARRFHGGLIYTEMISAEALCRKNARTMLYARIEEDHHPIAFQILGNQIERMVLAAQIVEGLGADIVDINAACPDRAIVRSGAGGGLLKTPDKLVEIIEQVVKGVSIPVSVKMRLGFPNNVVEGELSDDIHELAIRLQDAGASFLAVHGRTVKQRFGGISDTLAIKALVDALDIPILANGDARDEVKAVEILKATGAEGVMLGRGTRGRPDLPGTSYSYLNSGTFDRIPDEELVTTIFDHAGLEKEVYGEHAGMMRMRKHVLWYLKAAGHEYPHKRVYQLNTIVELEDLLAEVIPSDRDS